MSLFYFTICAYNWTLPKEVWPLTLVSRKACHSPRMSCLMVVEGSLLSISQSVVVCAGALSYNDHVLYVGVRVTWYQLGVLDPPAISHWGHQWVPTRWSLHKGYAPPGSSKLWLAKLCPCCHVSYWKRCAAPDPMGRRQKELRVCYLSGFCLLLLFPWLILMCIGWL